MILPDGLDATLAADLLADIEARRDAIIGLASELIASPSANPPGDEHVIAGLLRDRMTALGLDGAALAGPDARRTSVLWERAGDGTGPRLALAGHIDTKPPGDLDAWRHDPFDPVIADGHLHGLGAADMKAAIAAMVHAAAVVTARVARPTGGIALLLTADEENGMRHGASHLLAAGAIRADAIVIGEPAGIARDWEALHLLSRGMANLTVEVRGTQMHSSLADVLPSRNASLDMARLLGRFADELAVPDPAHPLCPQGVTVNVGATVSGGVSHGTCSGRAAFGVDIRFPPGLGRDEISTAVEQVLARAREDDPGLEATWAFAPAPGDVMPPTELDPDHPVVVAAIAASRAVLGAAPPLGCFPGATEAMIYRGKGGIPTLPALGPGCLPVCHAPGERVRLEAVIEAASMYALLLASAATATTSW
jgi:acetylornithine deacetylase/succinyl-diaminopimelate desuccinylase-like protein